jgi:uncharacterized membrane protein
MAATLAATGASAQQEAAVHVARDRDDAAWVRGHVLVSAPADAVWARIADVRRWRTVFSDVRRLRVISQRDTRWRLEMETRAFDCGAHEYDVRLEPQARVAHIVIDAPGVEAHGELRVRPGRAAGTADVTYRLRVEATGIVSWFVSEDTLRAKQEDMVRSYLRDLRDAFATRTGPARPPS